MPRGRRYLLDRVSVAVPASSSAAATLWPGLAPTVRPSRVKRTGRRLAHPEPLRERLERAEEVVLEHLLAALAVAVRDGVHQILVGRERVLQAHLRHHVGDAGIALRGDAQVHDPPHERRTARRAVVHEVEAVVPLVEEVDVAGLGRARHLAEEPLHLGDPSVGDALGAEACGEAFEADPHQVQLLVLLRRQLCDPSAAERIVPHEVLAREQLQRLPGRGLADAVLLRDLGGIELLAGRELAADDHLPQLLRDVVTRRRAAFALEDVQDNQLGGHAGVPSVARSSLRRRSVASWSTSPAASMTTP